MSWRVFDLSAAAKGHDEFGHGNIQQRVGEIVRHYKVDTLPINGRDWRETTNVGRRTEVLT